MFSSWSYSTLTQFEKCPQLHKWRKIEKRPEPPSAALARGNEIHAQLESAMRGESPVPKLKALDLLDYICELQKRKPQIEEMWAFDRNWKFLGVEHPERGEFIRGTWLRAKLDTYAAPVFGRKPKLARVVDWKTGRIYDDHQEQAELYAIASAQKESRALEEVEVDMVYVDQGSIEQWKIPLHDVEDMKAEWTERALVLASTKIFKPTPGGHCGYCPFSQRKKGPCRAG